MATASPSEVVARLHAFGLERDRVRAAMAGALRIGLTDVDALEYLERFGPLTQRDLGARLLLTSGAVTMLVDRLERLGLVRRRPHPSDRRALLVEIAPDAALPDVPEVESYHRALAVAAAALSPAGRSEVVDFLRVCAADAGRAADAMRARTPARARPTSTS
jgi:hypothetical protein